MPQRGLFHNKLTVWKRRFTDEESGQEDDYTDTSEKCMNRKIQYIKL